VTWDAELYLRFEAERTRPARDLAARIDLLGPRDAVDLGCGPGNSTQVLAERWPAAHLVGIDNSASMIATARSGPVKADWQVADLTAWKAPGSFDLVFSNAALQWVADHAELYLRLFDAVRPEGALAVQIPRNPGSLVQEIMRDVASYPRWGGRFETALRTLNCESAGFYYDLLAPHAQRIDIWETNYAHVLPDHDAIIEWIKATGLRPFLEALRAQTERDEFLEVLRTKVCELYPLQRDGRVLFMFKRLFVLAYRS
jgi:trans-aconitate 2-methyltransferase